MASPSAGSAREVGAQPPVDTQTVDTTQLDKLCEKAMSATKSSRHALAAALYGRAAEEALRLNGETFVCTYLTLQHSDQLLSQSDLEGTADEKAALFVAKAWALVSSSLPLIVRRMDDNTMLPGRGMAVELAFNKRYCQLARAVYALQPHTARELQLEGLSLGYATALKAAGMVLGCVSRIPGLNADKVHEAQAFVLRVMDSMQPAARSLGDYMLSQEATLASYLQTALSGTFFLLLNPAFITSLRAKWASAEMVQLRRARGLLVTKEIDEAAQKIMAEKKTSRLADVAKHGLKECALPSCGKLEASVGQHKRCSACRSVWYCSAEHRALHWKEHKPVCRATAASQHAAAGDGAARE